MSLQDYYSAIDLIEMQLGDFEGPKPETLVLKAEQALDLKFPQSYRQFLLQFGCGNVRGLEIFGLINDNFEESSIPNGIWLTLHERKEIGLNRSLIIIGEGGGGSYYVIDTSLIDEKSGENPVLRLSVDARECERVAQSFGAYLLWAIGG